MAHRVSSFSVPNPENSESESPATPSQSNQWPEKPLYRAVDVSSESHISQDQFNSYSASFDIGSKSLNHKSIGSSFSDNRQLAFGRYSIGDKAPSAGWESGFLQAPSLSDKVSETIPQTVSDAEPPARPAFLDPNHFFTALDAAEIRQHLQECSKELNFDQSASFTQSSQWSMPFTSYRQHSSVDFWVSVYSDAQNSRLVIELQRASGCSFAFTDAVRNLRQKLDDRCLIEFPAKRDWSSRSKSCAARRAQSYPSLLKAAADSTVYRSLHDDESLPPYKPLSSEEIAKAAAESVANALSLVESEFVEARGEGVRCIADLSLQPHAQSAIISTVNQEKDSIAIMVDTLSQDKVDMHRCAASALANMLSSDLVAQARVRVQTLNGHTKLLGLICRSDTPQVLREAARALVGFGAENLEALCQESGSQQELSDAVRKLQQHPCPRVQQYGACLQTH